MFALSTSWNAYRHTDGRALVEEIKRLGFDKIELSFNLTAEMIEAIETCVFDGFIVIDSLHNYCPIPDGMTRREALPDCYSLSSPDSARRAKAVLYTKRTIDTAVRLKAKAVVVHCGRVDIPDRTVELIGLYNRGLRRGDAEMAARRADIMRERAEHAPAYIDNILKSLDELNAYAASRSVFLGVETRYYHREIPTFDEMDIIFRSFPGSNLRYWHDTGHAMLADTLGIIPSHLDFLHRYGDKLFGIHIHDIRGCSDHRPAGTGDIKFGELARYIRDAQIKVLEIHQPATGDELTAGRDFLQGVLDGTRNDT